MCGIEYSERGSEWRKWDLHLHSPSSYDYDGEEISNQEIIQKLKMNDISAAVISDHHKIDVDRINELVKLGENEGILILPGIEFRSELGGSSSVHFIAIFNNSNIDTIWTKIQGKINLTEEDIENKGGDDGFSVNAETACEIIHNLGGIITVHAGKNRANSIENISNKPLYKEVLKDCLLADSFDVLEVSKKKHLTEYYDIIFPTLNQIHPLVAGSDCHDIKKYQLRLPCWIKSDLSFEGLKQILYEPEERVKIQEIKPDAKSDYEVIDSVCFNDKNFIKNEIKINSNLVSIIGSKSTGKSILLRSIANAIDKKEVKEKVSDFDYLINPKIIVKWKNSDIYEYPESLGNNSEKKIMYIPQGYLNKSVDSTNPKSFANKIIQDLLKRDAFFKEKFISLDKLKTKYENDVYKKINEYFDLLKTIEEEHNSIVELGDLEDIKKEVEKLKKELEKIPNNDIEEEDKKIQTELNERIIKNSRLIENQNNKKNVLKSYIDEIKYLNTLINPLPYETFDEETINEINLLINVNDFIYKENICQKILEEINNTDFIKEKLLKECSKDNESLKSLNEKIKLSESSKNIFKKINIEKEKEEEITIKNNNLLNLEKKSKNILNDIYLLNIQFIKSFNNKTKDFKFEGEQNIFVVSPLFETETFNEKLELLNRKKFYKFKEKTKIDLENFQFDSKTFSTYLKEIVDGILDDELTTKSKVTKKDLIHELFKPYLYINFNILEGEDTLEIMSPGKRSFALLKVLIKLDKNKCPILIDQPEDDLDSKSISKDLISFLKKTKKERQIIIVSHNPNLVVGADSEQIIVANQEGKDLKNKSKKFEYISGSIENTFTNNSESCYLYNKGIKEYICDILEGGEESFRKRQAKYNIK